MGPHCTPDTRVTKPSVLPKRKGGLRAAELLHRTPGAGTMDISEEGPPNVLLQDIPWAFAEA